MKLIGKYMIMSCALAFSLASCGKSSNSHKKEEEPSSELFIFEQNDSGYTLKGVTDNEVTSLDIPATYKDMPINYISDEALYECHNLESINLPSTLEAISSSLFKNLPLSYNEYNGGYYLGNTTNPYLYLIKSDNVSEAIINPKTRIIGEGVYEGFSLSKVTLNESLYKISNRAFYDNDYLYSITLPNSLKAIEGEAFMSCDNLYEIYNYSHLSLSIGTYDNGYVASNARFINKNGAESIISSGDDGIYMTLQNDKYLLKYLGNDDEPTITSDVDIIAKNAFAGSQIKKINIPSNVKEVEDGAFKDCKNLTDAIISDGVGVLGDNTFMGDSALKNITIPGSLNSVGVGAFLDCDSLENVYYSSNISNWAKIMFKYQMIDSMTSNPMSYAQNIYYLDGGVYKEPTSINIPSDVERINAGQFMNFSLLEGVIFDGNTQVIDSYAFKGCTSLKAFNIPNSIHILESLIFEGCTSLEEISFGDNIKEINNIFGSERASLKKVLFNGDENAWAGIAFANEGSVFESDAVYFKNAEAYYKPTTLSLAVSQISAYAFAGFKNIESVYLDKSVKSIGVHAFKDCSELNGVYYNGTIGDWCKITFNTFTSNPLVYAHDLYLEEAKEYYLCENIVLTNGLINSYAFYNSSIKSVLFEDSVKSLGMDSFNGCSELSWVYYHGNEDGYSRLVSNIDESSKLSKLYVYYYAEEKPEGDGRYWHYNSSGSPERW